MKKSKIITIIGIFGSIASIYGLFSGNNQPKQTINKDPIPDININNDGGNVNNEIKSQDGNNNTNIEDTNVGRDLIINQAEKEVKTDVSLLIRVSLFDNIDDQGKCRNPNAISMGGKRPVGTCMWDEVFFDSEPDIAIIINSRLIPCNRNSYSCEHEESFKLGEKYNIRIVELDGNGQEDEIGQLSFLAKENLRVNKDFGKIGNISLNPI